MSETPDKPGDCRSGSSVGYPADRVFTDKSHEDAEATIRAKVEAMGLACRWVRSDCVGPTGRPYVKRQLAAVSVESEFPAVSMVARVDRRNRVAWHVPWSSERFEIEPG